MFGYRTLGFGVGAVRLPYSISYLVVAGGASGAKDNAEGPGGGGAGGYRTGTYTVTPNADYAVTVGAGGAKPASSNAYGINGSDSVLGTVAITSDGGGGAGYAYRAGLDGGSGGGGGGHGYTGHPGGSGTAGQGNDGGNGFASYYNCLLYTSPRPRA